MKKVVFMIIALLSLTAAQAQEENKEQKKERRMEMRNDMRQRPDRVAMMKNRYGLSDEQVEQVKKLNDEYKDIMMMRPRGWQGPGRGNFGRNNDRMGKPEKEGMGSDQQQMQRPSREEIEKRMQERQQKQAEYDAKMKEILNEEQYAKYEADQKMMREQRPGRPTRDRLNRIEPQEKESE